MIRLLYILLICCTSLVSLQVLAQTAVHDSISEPLIKKPGTIYVRKNPLDTASKNLLGIWGLCLEENLSSKHVCRSYISTFEFLENGTYVQVTRKGKGYETMDGQWEYRPGQLHTVESTKSGEKKSGTDRIIWITTKSFYTPFPGKPNVYIYYEKTNGHIGPAFKTHSSK